MTIPDSYTLSCLYILKFTGYYMHVYEVVKPAYNDLQLIV